MQSVRKLSLLLVIAILGMIFPSGALASGYVEARAVENFQVEPIVLETPMVRIKDIARLQGVRSNQLFGLGLVIGLAGTGDGSRGSANVQMIANMLNRFGVTVSPDDLRVRNVAAVMVTAEVPTGVRPGDRIDVTVSSIGDARSLQGGFLLQTPLQAANGRIYAAAQGPVSIGGFSTGSGGSLSGRNHATVARIPNGAIVEQEIVSDVTDGQGLTLILQEPDFSTAARITSVINQAYYRDIAWAQDQSTILVEIPSEYRSNIVQFIAELEELPVRPDSRARVIINERTGTVVMGAGVRISTVAVSHGNLNVQVEQNLVISQPPALSEGQTVVGTETEMTVSEEQNPFIVFDAGNSVEDLVKALNAIGVSPRDIIAILQAIKAAGALYGELIIL